MHVRLYLILVFVLGTRSGTFEFLMKSVKYSTTFQNKKNKKLEWIGDTF